MPQRRTVQLSAAAVAHHIRGEPRLAEELVREISAQPADILTAFASLCVVTGEALALLTDTPLAAVLGALPTVDASPIRGARVLRTAAVAYVLGQATGDERRARVAGAELGDTATAINSMFNVAAAIVHSLAGEGDPAQMAATVATLMAVTAVSSPVITDPAGPIDLP